jgi:hypothetical protein
VKKAIAKYKKTLLVLKFKTPIITEPTPAIPKKNIPAKKVCIKKSIIIYFSLL